MEMKNMLVGYGRADITPDQPAPMAGYGTASKRLHETVLDPLYATCVAITDDQDNTLLLFSQDIIRSHNDTGPEMIHAKSVCQDDRNHRIIGLPESQNDKERKTYQNCAFVVELHKETSLSSSSIFIILKYRDLSI